MAKRLDIYEYTHLKKKSKIGVEWSVEKWEDVAGSNLRQKSTLDEIIKASGALVYGDHSLHLGAESTKLGVEAVHKRSSELQTGDCANWLSGYSYGTEVRTGGMGTLDISGSGLDDQVECECSAVESPNHRSPNCNNKDMVNYSTFPHHVPHSDIFLIFSYAEG